MNSEIEYNKNVAVNAIYKIYECAQKKTHRKDVELAAAMKVVIDTIEKFAQEFDK